MGEVYKLRIIGKHTGKQWRFHATKIKETSQIVQFRINGNDRNIVLQSVYPLLKAKGLKQRKVVWKIVDGHINSFAFAECIGELLTKILRAEDGRNDAEIGLYSHK